MLHDVILIEPGGRESGRGGAGEAASPVSQPQEALGLRRSAPRVGCAGEMLTLQRGAFGRGCCRPEGEGRLGAGWAAPGGGGRPGVWADRPFPPALRRKISLGLSPFLLILCHQNTSSTKENFSLTRSLRSGEPNGSREVSVFAGGCGDATSLPSCFVPPLEFEPRISALGSH